MQNKIEKAPGSDHTPIATFDAALDQAFNEHGDEIRDYADRIDDGDDALSEAVDDVIADIKSKIGAEAANNVSDDEAETAIEAVERWVTDSISNSTSDRRVAAVFAHLGEAESKRQLS